MKQKSLSEAKNNNSPPRRRLQVWEKIILVLILLVLVVFGFSRCQRHRARSKSADAQWALENLSLAQRAYFEAYKVYSRDYVRLAGFGFQEYSNIYYSDIVVSPESERPGWCANVRYKSRQATTYNYDSLRGGFIDITK